MSNRTGRAVEDQELTSSTPATEQSPAPGIHTDEQVRHERRGALMFLGLVVAMIIASIVYASVTDEPEVGPGEASGELPGVLTFNYRGGEHTNDDVTYAENPPAGGSHDDVWQNCAPYQAPVIDEQAVHSLEHGAVWITYRPDLDPEQVAQLNKLAESQDYILVSPYAGIPSPIVASAWNHQLQLPTATDPGLMEFVRSYRLGSSAPEPGAPCDGGSSDVAAAE